MARCGRARGSATRLADLSSKIAALMLVALILLPFTPPFKTYELDSSRKQGSSHDWLVKDKIGSDEMLVAASDASLVPPVLNVIVLESFTRPGLTDGPQLQSLILRI